ncbi:MAG: hypothetical protein EA408_10955 [Marinilabiliales bacterium]|nr:MAG: hypothetical protein EA408_10955 [Marinilabiliales bacterium]
MRPFLLIFIAVIVILPEAIGQAHLRSPQDRITGVTLNMNWMQMADRYFSPLRYNGPGAQLEIFSVRDNVTMRRHLNLGAKADYMLNRHGFEAFYLQPAFSLGLTFLVDPLSSDNGFTYAGGSASAMTRMYRFVNEDPDKVHWTTSYTLDFHYVFDLEIDRDKKLIAELKIPLAGAVSRPSDDIQYTFQFPGFGRYMIRLHENIGFAGPHNMQALNLRLAYDLSRTRRRAFTIGYEVDFARFSEPAPVIYFSNSIFFRFNYLAFVW